MLFRPVKRIAAAALVASALLMFSATSAQAVGTLDQSITGTRTGAMTVDATYNAGQSFTAGRSGLLDRIIIGTLREQGDAGVLQVKIFLTLNGGPTGAPLAEQDLPSSATSTVGWGPVVVDFTYPATVTAGTQYTVVLAAPYAVDGGMDGPSTRYFLGVIEPDPAPNEGAAIWNGSTWVVRAYDAALETYVTPLGDPTPTEEPTTAPTTSPTGTPAAVDSSQTPSSTVASTTLAATGSSIDGYLAVMFIALIAGAALTVSTRTARQARR
jgi:hypothetical protein